MTAIAVGIVGKPLGLRGEVYVLPDPDLDVPFEPGAAFAAGARALVVATSRLHGNRRVVRFEGVETREDAEALRGHVLRVDRTTVAIAEDAFWADEIVGRAVITADGASVGTVAGLADGAAHDYLVVDCSGGEQVLIPAVDELVEVTAAGIVVQPLPGLLGDVDQV